MSRHISSVLFMLFLGLLGINSFNCAPPQRDYVPTFEEEHNCPEGTRWVMRDDVCESICKDGAKWSPEEHKCVSTCSEGYRWNVQAGYCVSVCNDGTEWDGEHKTCRCPEGTIPYTNGLRKFCLTREQVKELAKAIEQVRKERDCKAGTKWDDRSETCITICQGGTWDAKKATCICPEGQNWDSFFGTCTTRKLLH